MVAMGYFTRLMFRTKASKLTIESFAPGPSAAHPGSFFQKRALARNTGDGLSRPEHVVAAFSPDFPLSGRLPPDEDRPFLALRGTRQEGPVARV